MTRRQCDDGHDVTAAIRPGADLWRLQAPGSNFERLRIQPLDVADGQAVARLLGTVSLVDACRACGCEALVKAGSSS